jgi:tetratricopeptide (TPR) repeat protein
MRRLAAWAAALVAATLAISLRPPRAGTAAIVDSPLLGLEPRLVIDSWAVAPPPLLRFVRYPLEAKEIRFRFALESPRAVVTREGSAVGVEGMVEVRALRERLLELHRRHGRRYRDSLVLPALREALAQQARELGYDGLRAQGVLGLEGRTAEALGRRLEGEGMGLASLRVERLEFAAADRGAEALGRPERSGARVLLVGLDGADWSLIEPLMARGRLPNLQRLVREGARARLRTLTPTLSPVLWTSVATGKRPEKHGILDFLATRRDTGERIPVTSNLRRARPLWHILGDHGLSSSVVAWWATWPAEPLRGTLASDRIAYQLFGLEEDRDDATSKTWPPELYGRLRPLVRAPADVSEEEIERFIPDLRRERLEARYPELLREFRSALASARSYSDIALMLLRREKADFHAVYLEGIDAVSHLFMRYAPPRARDVSADEVRWFGAVVERYYEHEDEVIGRLVEAAGPGVTVVVCSDHGFRSGRDRPPGDSRIAAGRAAEWHRKYGILAMAGEPIQAEARLEEASLLDVAPTLLAIFGLPTADDFDGRVLEPLLRPEFLRRHPLRRVATYEPAVIERAAADPVASAADAAIRSKLAALGYITLEGSNAHNNRGSLLLSEGRADEAIAALEEALRQDPGFAPAKLNLARAWLQKRDLVRARRLLEEVLERLPDHAAAENLLGNILMEGGDLAGAEARFRRAVRLNPDFTDGHNSLGVLYERTGRLEEAEAAYHEVVRIDPDYAEAHNNLGNVLRAQGRWEAAVRAYERAIAADPDFQGSYNNLGLAYQERGMFEQAERALLQGLEKAPRHPILHSSLGSLHYAAGRFEQARAEFAAAIGFDPEYAEAHNNLGAALGRLGRVEEQERAYRRAIELAPGYADARYNLALLLAARGDVEGALAELRRAVEADPGHVRSWGELAVLSEKRGDLGEAIAALESAKRVDPLLPEIYNRLGELYLRVGQRERAEREWRRSLELAPRQPRVREHLGLAN